MRLRGEIGASSSRCEQETSTEQLPVCQADSDYKLRGRLLQVKKSLCIAVTKTDFI